MEWEEKPFNDQIEERFQFIKNHIHKKGRAALYLAYNIFRSKRNSTCHHIAHFQKKIKKATN